MVRHGVCYVALMNHKTPRSPLQLAVVLNPGSGAASDDTRARVLELLESEPEVARIAATIELGDEPGVDAALSAALDAGADRIVACGGDGTVRACLETALTRSVPLAVIPLGTANSFASSLGIRDIDHACEVARGANVARVDAARVNGEPMILVASLGIHADAIAKAGERGKETFGNLAYMASFAIELGNAEPFEVRLETRYGEATFDATALSIANTARTGALLSNGMGEVVDDDGQLDVTLILARSLGEFLMAGAELALGTITGVRVLGEQVASFRASDVRVRCKPARRLLVDGEDLGSVETLDVSCLAGALSIAVPESAAQDVVDEAGVSAAS